MPVSQERLEHPLEIPQTVLFSDAALVVLHQLSKFGMELDESGSEAFEKSLQIVFVQIAQYDWLGPNETGLLEAHSHQLGGLLLT